MVKVNFCAITQNRWYQFEENVSNAYDYVDRIVIVDGGSTDDTVEGLVNLAKSHNDKYYVGSNFVYDGTDYKVIVIQSEWDDNFPKQRQKYINAVGQYSLYHADEANYIAQADSDEFYSEGLLQDLKRLCKYANVHFYSDNGYSHGYGLRCHTINEDEYGTHINIDDFWKLLIYRYVPELGISARSASGKEHNVHEYFTIPIQKNDLKSDKYYYRHVKTQRDVYQRAFARNFFIGGGGPNYGEEQLLWKPFRELVKECMGKEPETWWEFDAYLQSDNVDKRIEDWIIKHRYEGLEDVEHDLSDMEKKMLKLTGSINYDGASEVREGYLYYFNYLHPDKKE